MFLSLDFDDRHERSRGGPLSVVVSQWDGCVSVWDVTAADRASGGRGGCGRGGSGGGSGGRRNNDGNGGPRRLHLWDAHKLPGGQVAEAWIAAFDCWHPKTVLTGGDDGALYGWDLRAPGRPATGINTSVNKSTDIDTPPLKIFARYYDAGVCSVHFDEFREHRVAVGGYFGAVEILDMRALSSAGSLATAMVTPLNRWETGGGVWRLKWHPSSVGVLASACMRGGVRVFQDPTGAAKSRGADGTGSGSADGATEDQHGLVCRYTGHPGEALAYGVSWQRKRHGGSSGGGGGGRGGGKVVDTIASCSFYDHALHFWKV
jgi:diphthamide biosynthesis protein 7